MASGGCIGPDSGRRRVEGTPEPPPRPLLNPQPKLSPRTPDRASPYPGVCYTCKQGGHWSKDCPSKESASRTQFRVDGARMEIPQCPCGAGPCVLLTSHTDKNPGRQFFRCPSKTPFQSNEGCSFFQWCDSTSPYQLNVASPAKGRLNLGSPIEQQARNTPQQDDYHPLCQCGAGWCIILEVKEGEHTARKYFACPRKKSEERCKFKQWCVDFDVTGKTMRKSVNRDLVSPLSNTYNIQYPLCACGAGRCRLLTMEHGEYAGRKYFGCTVKKGQGACNFFQWQNAAEGEHSSGKSHLVGDNNQHPDSAKVRRSLSNVEPTHLNFDNMEVGGTNVGPSPILERRQWETGGLLDQNHRTSSHNMSLDRSPKHGKCYRCGREGHWVKDCVEPLPPPQM